MHFTLCQPANKCSSSSTPEQEQQSSILSFSVSMSQEVSTSKSLKSPSDKSISEESKSEDKSFQSMLADCLQMRLMNTKKGRFILLINDWERQRIPKEITFQPQSFMDQESPFTITVQRIKVNVVQINEFGRFAVNLVVSGMKT